MKKRIYKSFLILMVSLTLWSGPITQNEIRRLLEELIKTSATQEQELDEEEIDSENLKDESTR